MNRYSGMTIWQLREELAAIKGELAIRDVTPRPEPELAAKEQPGEQNAAPQARTTGSHSAGPGAPAVSAPDAAAMVKRLREKTRMISRTDQNGCIILTDAEANEAAAMIEKLGQRWIPVGERLPDGLALWLNANGTMYVGEWDGPPHENTTHWMPLPPPPERP